MSRQHGKPAGATPGRRAIPRRELYSVEFHATPLQKEGLYWTLNRALQREKDEGQDKGSEDITELLSYLVEAIKTARKL